jgi:2-haloacid dehalogenase
MDQLNGQCQAIVFDFGGVLFDWNPRYLYRRFFDGNPEAMERFLADTDFTAWNLRLDEGEPFASVMAELCERFPHYAPLFQAYDQCYDETLAGVIQPNVDTLGRLKQAGYPLYALSNWSMEKYAVIRPRYDFLNWFADVVISGDVKLVKPDPAIFRILLARIDRPPDMCLFIDDSPKNVETADRLGFRSLWYQSPEQLRATLVQLKLLHPEWE